MVAVTRAAENLGCKVEARDDGIFIIPPLGLEVNLRHEDPYVLKHCLMQAARITVMNNLSVRVNGNVDHFSPP